MHVRKCRPGEEDDLWRLFFDTVRTVNLRDYTPEQVRAWAPEQVDQEAWRSRIRRNDPFVCECAGQIVGFADLQESGFIDQFFVHCHWQGRGVGKRLLAAIETAAREASLAELSSHVSVTARPFFESRGFVVVAPQEVAVGAVVLKNFQMRKRLAAV